MNCLAGIAFYTPLPLPRALHSAIMLCKTWTPSPMQRSLWNLVIWTRVTSKCVSTEDWDSQFFMIEKIQITQWFNFLITFYYQPMLSSHFIDLDLTCSLHGCEGSLDLISPLLNSQFLPWLIFTHFL